MSRLRISVLKTALIAGALLVGGLAAPASAVVRPNITGVGSGTGTTAALAEHHAAQDMKGSYSGCGPWSVDWVTEDSPGVWEAEVSAGCSGAN